MCAHIDEIVVGNALAEAMFVLVEGLKGEDHLHGIESRFAPWFRRRVAVDAHTIGVDDKRCCRVERLDERQQLLADRELFVAYLLDNVALL